MTDPAPQKPQSALTNPQVLAAIIGGILTLTAAALGILPSVLNRPAEATAVIIVTATFAPTAVEVVEPTAAQPTSVPVAATEAVATVTPLPAIVPTEITPTAITPQVIASPPPNGNVLLLYDDVSFTIVNQDNRTLSFVGVTFTSERGFWDARDWGPSIYNSLPSRNCLRLRDAASGQRQPPGECANLYGLILVGTPAIFWRGTDSFDVQRDGQVIATCPTASGSCLIAIS